MKMFKQAALILLSGLLVLACNQDPIFFEVSLEVKPIPPRISGAPTNIVAVENMMYVASKRGTEIYRYECYPEADPAKNSEWITPLPSPGGKILELAATDGKLYALCGEPMSATLWRYNGSDWDGIDGATNVQTIYGAGTYLFAGIAIFHSTDNPAITGSISYIGDSETSLSSLAASNGYLLSGAAFMTDTYYLATSGSGLFTVDTSNLSNPSASALLVGSIDHKNIVGIKNVGDTIVAVAREGYGVPDYILYGDSDSFTPVLTGVKFTGALSLYEKKADSSGEGAYHLLLLGIQASSTSTVHGYREIVLGADGAFPTTVGLQTPGATATSSVIDTDQYTVTIGAQPLSSLFQAKDGTPFASTMQKGLWAYRERDNELYWNTEG